LSPSSSLLLTFLFLRGVLFKVLVDHGTDGSDGSVLEQLFDLPFSPSEEARLEELLQKKSLLNLLVIFLLQRRRYPKALELFETSNFAFDKDMKELLEAVKMNTTARGSVSNLLPIPLSPTPPLQQVHQVPRSTSTPSRPTASSSSIFPLAIQQAKLTRERSILSCVPASSSTSDTSSPTSSFNSFMQEDDEVPLSRQRPTGLQHQPQQLKRIFKNESPPLSPVKGPGGFGSSRLGFTVSPELEPDFDYALDDVSNSSRLGSLLRVAGGVEEDSFVEDPSDGFSLGPFDNRSHFGHGRAQGQIQGRGRKGEEMEEEESVSSQKPQAPVQQQQQPQQRLSLLPVPPSYSSSSSSFVHPVTPSKTAPGSSNRPPTITATTPLVSPIKMRLRSGRQVGTPSKQPSTPTSTFSATPSARTTRRLTTDLSRRAGR
jgi:hypothetical protein